MAKQTDLSCLAGKFIVLDGGDGCGKTTQLKLLADKLREYGLTVAIAKDPGGTTVGDRIRHILLDYDLSAMDVRCEALLFMASRAQLVSQVIGPALQAGDVVLGDRFVSSTCAYQGAAGADIQKILQLARFANGDTWPDLTIVLDVPAEQGLARAGRTAEDARKNVPKNGLGQQGPSPEARVDAMEARPLDFHRSVRKILLSLPEVYPAPVVIVDGTAEARGVHELVLQAIREHFAG